MLTVLPVVTAPVLLVITSDEIVLVVAIKGVEPKTDEPASCASGQPPSLAALVMNTW
jgi:hypothetical protein